MRVKLISKSEIAEGTTEFCFEKPAGLEFKPGQYFTLKLIDPPETDDKGNERDFSVVSTPDDEKICFATRMRNSAFKNVLKNMPAGSEIELEGPYGRMVLPRDTSKPLVFIAGGIGITPFMSMIRHVVRENMPYEIYLFYSNRRPEDSAYLDELRQYDNQKKIHLIATMTEMEKSSQSWEGETELINKEMLSKYLGDALKDAIFYVVGPPGMTYEMNRMLEEMDIPPERINGEDFIGY